MPPSEAEGSLLRGLWWALVIEAGLLLALCGLWAALAWVVVGVFS